MQGVSWSYGSWVYDYLCNQAPITTKVVSSNPTRWGVLDTTLCDKVCQWFATGQWVFLCAPVSSTNKTDRHDITEILLKVALCTITLTSLHFYIYICWLCMPIITTEVNTCIQISFWYLNIELRFKVDIVKSNPSIRKWLICTDRRLNLKVKSQD